jgi:hypothetical protein
MGNHCYKTSRGDALKVGDLFNMVVNEICQLIQAFCPLLSREFRPFSAFELLGSKVDCSINIFCACCVEVFGDDAVIFWIL